MRDQNRKWLRMLLVGAAVALPVPAGAGAASLHPKLLGKVGYGSAPVGFARTGDGTLHVVLDQNTNWGDSYNGIAAVSINPAGKVGAPAQALNWNGQSAQGIPGLAVMPSGALEATWGGYPFGDNGPWGISSTNGGSSWSPPGNVGSGSMNFGDANVSMAVSNGTPVIAAGCCGGIVIQQGFGSGAPTYQLTNSSDNVAGQWNLAADAATGAVVAGWDSNGGSGGLWLQQVAPGQPGGPAVKLPVPSQYGTGIPPIVAGRDSGPGVFVAYPTNYVAPTHISLARYGGGTVSVGSAKNLFAHVWGIATGPGGRIWVMWWGQNTKTGKQIMALTRSNKAVTKFEPIQQYDSAWSYQFYLTGDGRLGPLDMLVSGTPFTKICCGTGGIYYMRVLPVLSAHVSAAGVGGGKFKLTVKVTDAGDAVAGAHASAKGNGGTTNSSGTAKFTISGSPGQNVTVTITDPGYQTLKVGVTL